MSQRFMDDRPESEISSSSFGKAKDSARPRRSQTFISNIVNILGNDTTRTASAALPVDVPSVESAPAVATEVPTDRPPLSIFKVSLLHSSMVADRSPRVSLVTKMKMTSKTNPLVEPRAFVCSKPSHFVFTSCSLSPPANWFQNTPPNRVEEGYRSMSCKTRSQRREKGS